MLEAAAMQWYKARKILLDSYNDPAYKFDAKLPLPTERSAALSNLGRAETNLSQVLGKMEQPQ